ncbi:VOC family protein [Neptunicoccus cionae]|uniref:VOC family protein n=1 Tax=Neptunicoccus cionae TaxID=2035344 RepID=UPI000C7947AA|nr:VOC family protein [Amylibacter cionae]PLS22393.1 glyoxalase [Amylibacter cionae]
MTQLNKPAITGVYETHLPVRNLETSIAFYRDVMGLELAHRNTERNIAFFWVGGKNRSMLGLWGAGSAPLGMVLHFAFQVDRDTILNSYDFVKEAGLAPLGLDGEPVQEPVVIGWMPAVSIYFKDPDGHSIEMIHILDEPSRPDFGVQPLSAWLAGD